MSPVVRAAGVDDAVSIARLYTEISDEVVEREPRVRHIPDEAGAQRRFEARVVDADRGVFVATIDDSIVGFADAVLFRNADVATYHSPGVDAYVDELVVSRSFQRRGIGRALMTSVEAWASENGARWVTIDTHVSNCAGRALYGALGYREIGVKFAKDL